jgi:hypothetical protein
MTPAFEPASFRDRHARVFRREGRILRALTAEGLRDWHRLAAASFFQRHVDEGTVVRTCRAPDEAMLLAELGGGSWAAVLEHDPVPFISYPFEWTFGMLRDAALLHLDLLRQALDHGLILKDATPYNVQFVGARPSFIDTASFTLLRPGEVWQAYRQFCRLFLYPLMLQAYKDIPFHPWLRGRLDGIGAPEMRAVLNARDLARPGVLAHVLLHARAEGRFEGRPGDVRGVLKEAGFGAALIKANVTRLRRLIERLGWSPRTSTWAGYGDTHTYTATDVEQKSAFVRAAVRAAASGWVWDLGANTGAFAKIAAEDGRRVLALDADAPAVERVYLDVRGRSASILPLVGNVIDPSPSLGWRGAEHLPLERRGRPALTLCLALVHHIVISGNVPLPDFVEWIASLGGDLVIEFVTKNDPMVRRLLVNKDDQYADYDQPVFETALARHFTIAARQTIHGGTRVLYHGTRAR